METLRAVR